MSGPSEFPESFNLGLFHIELAQITEEYAQAAYITFVYDRAHSQEREAEQTKQAAELYARLLDICANAIIATRGNEVIMTEIYRIVILYQYGNGHLLFGGSAIAEFYEKLAMRVAAKSA